MNINAIDFDRGSNEQHTHEIETLEGAISADEIMQSMATLMGEKNIMKELHQISLMGGEEHDEDEFTCYMYKECNNLMTFCFWVAIPNSTIIKWHQHSNSLALSTINKEGWKRKVETNLLKLEHGLQYLNLTEGSKFEDENAYYVVIANRLGQSSLVQIILGANSHISILLLLVEDDDSHCYIIMTENSCEEYFSL
ncbi:hypothetical protein H5410_059689 [Solanum commersonii]|uniref:Uncharacterized protein n=1 Tax=Solanum commersonii TaxID=4109 RepID=A0A9J5W324_SOLCO|nr:hypothetical protein H5410_059689 [Solanum commersonii]